MMNKEFQHCMESILIVVINLKMLMIHFVSIVNLIQMKLMKVIYKMKSISNKESQHGMESKLIEIMNMKMQMIQPVSTVNLIQMKAMKSIHKMKNKLDK
jgi:hypothetical protein